MANILRTSFLLWFFVIALYGGKSQASTAAKVYDVTNYGASRNNGNNKDAFLAAWRAACGSTSGNTTLFFPKGSFAVSAIEFVGPCRNGDAPVVVIDGVLQPGGSQLSGDAWITFSGVNNLLVTGVSTLDTQGDQSGMEWKFKRSFTVVPN